MNLFAARFACRGVKPEATAVSPETVAKQLLHLVFGGELTELHDVTFVVQHRSLAPDADAPAR